LWYIRDKEDLMKTITKLILVLQIAVITSSGFSIAADEQSGAHNPESITGFSRRLEPNRFLTSGGIKVKSGGEVTVEPEFGVSHVVHQREITSGHDNITHKVHAQAGGKLKLSELFYLGFATKLPIYNYGATEGHTPGGSATPSTPGRHDYEILRLSPNNLTWTGEMGLHLGQLIDLNLYYDQNILKGPLQTGVKSDEEVIGTRFILRFK
jgi:hypothetical protein